MSFKFNWNFFNKDSLLDQTSEVFKLAMNKGIKPDIIIGDMSIDKFELGTVPPDLEILEIGDLGADKFRGIFKLEYNGDASLAIQTMVEANPLALLNSKAAPKLRSAFPTIVGAASTLELPLSIYISEFKLSAIVIIVFSMARGLTLVFQNDPLQSVKVSSTFDSLPGIAEFLQQEVEARLRESFRDDIPEVLYRLSQEKLAKRDSEDVRELMANLQHLPHSHRYSNAFAYTNDMVVNETYQGSDETVNGLHDLDASHSTLSLNGVPSIPSCVTRSTLESFEKEMSIKAAFDELERLRNHKSVKRNRRLSNSSVSSLSSLDELSSLSPKLYKDVNPKRRVIKLKRDGPSTPTSTSTPASASTPISASTPTLASTPPSTTSTSIPTSTPISSPNSSPFTPNSTPRSRRRSNFDSIIRNPSPIKLDFRAVLEKQARKEKLNLSFSDSPEKALKWDIKNQIIPPPKYGE